MSLFVQPWVRGAEIRDWDALNARLGDLEFVLRELLSRVANGPMPGGYFPVSIHRPGAVAVGSGLWRLKTPVELRPILVSVGVKAGSGEVTIQLLDDGANLLKAPLTTSGGLAVLRSRGDFTREKVAADSELRLDVTATSGAPSELSVLVAWKGVGKIEVT